MGNPIQVLADHVTLIAQPRTWIEGDAIQQLITTAKLAGMQSVVGMPDLHPGRGYPVGAAFFSTGVFYPALIGNDIGCGMALWQTGMRVGQTSLDKLEKQIGSIDGPLDETWESAIANLNLPNSGFERSLGTIGGGNHFAELQKVESIFDADLFQSSGLDRKRLLLLVHSGSRGLGQAVLQQHVQNHGHAGLVEDSPAARDYLQQHDAACRFAAANRQLIARRMLARWRSDGECRFDILHNTLTPATVDGTNGWLHRKGASPADQGLLVIPGSRGDYSYLVHATPDVRSLFSLAHGAGRKWRRGDCQAQMKSRSTLAELSRTALGSRVICHDRQLLVEEAPDAYKRIDDVVQALQAAGLLQLVARLQPVLTYKNAGGCCE